MDVTKVKSRDEIVREIQKEQLRLLKRLSELSETYNFEFFLHWGSMLGAVRHKGFIPWDDDLDIGMTLDDYDKLRAVPKEAWGEDFLLVDPGEDTTIHDQVFPRIYLNKSIVQSERDIVKWKQISDGSPFWTRMMCDIFFIGPAPASQTAFVRNQAKMERMLTKYTLTKYRALPFRHSMKHTVKIHLKNAYGNWMRIRYRRPWKKVWQDYRTVIASGTDCTKICCYAEKQYATLTNYDTFYPLRAVAFEGLQLKIPNHAEELLTQYYGDYMSYPPPEERFHINFIYLDLGNGKIYNIDPIPRSLGAKQLASQATQVNQNEV